MRVLLIAVPGVARGTAALCVVATFVVLFPATLRAKGSGTKNDKTLQYESVCKEVEHDMHVMLNSVPTVCFPFGVAKPSTAGFVLVADGRVFAAPQVKKTWVLMVVGMLGMVLNQHPAMPCNEVGFADTDGVKSRHGYKLPCATVKEIQRSFHDNKLTLEEGWTRLDSALTEFAIPVNASAHVK